MKKFKESLLNKTFQLIKENPSKFLYTLLFDSLFILLISVINNISYMIIPQDPAALQSLPQSQMISVILFLPLYLLLTLIIYSTFKYFILNIISSLFTKKEASTKNLSKFYLLNLIIFSAYLIIFITLTLIYSSTIKPEYMRLTYLLTVVPLTILAYIFLNIAHTIFIKKLAIKTTLTQAYNLTFKKFKQYLPPILVTISIYILSIIIFFISLSLTLPQIYIQITSLILFYLMIAFNRIYIFKITNRAE